jgi:hypothetical protein
MTHAYTIDSAVYNGSSTDPNPRVWIHGTVDGISSGYFQTFWAGIQQAYAVNGAAGVQAFLAPILYRGIYSVNDSPYTGNPTTDVSGPPVPQFFSSNISPAVVSGPLSISVPQALVPPWSQ